MCENWILLCYIHFTVPLAHYRCAWVKKSSNRAGGIRGDRQEGVSSRLYLPQAGVTWQWAGLLLSCVFFMEPCGPERHIWCPPRAQHASQTMDVPPLATVNVPTLFLPSSSFFLQSSSFLSGWSLQINDFFSNCLQGLPRPFPARYLEILYTISQFQKLSWRNAFITPPIVHLPEN